jgi:hypothetical protein
MMMTTTEQRNIWGGGDDGRISSFTLGHVVVDGCMQEARWYRHEGRTERDTVVVVVLVSFSRRLPTTYRVGCGCIPD